MMIVMRYRWSTRWRARTRACCIAAVTLTIAQMGMTVAVAAQTSSISGTVRDSVGGGVIGASVSAAGLAAQAVTDSGGHFRLDRVPVGPADIIVRRLGFKPARVPVTNTADGVNLEITVFRIPQSLSAVVVRERRQPFDNRLAGFHARAANKVGHFITRERIEQQHSTFLTEYLRNVPGLKVRTINGFRNAVRLRGANCPPLVFIDGFPASAGEFDLDIIDPVSVEGIEIYSGSATVPAEFVGPRQLDRCGVIAVWSRPMRPYARAQVRPGRSAGTVSSALEEGGVFAADQVDRVARMEGDLPVMYPDSLWRARVGGRVVAQFIVDTTGAVELRSVGIVSSTHPQLSAAVREALELAVFVPALAKNRRVRQVVVLPVDFVPGQTGSVRPRPTDP